MRNKRTNSFTNLLNFAFIPNLYFFVFPLIAFILDRIALIFQNRFLITGFFRIFANKNIYKPRIADQLLK